MPAPPHSAMQALTASLTVRPASQSAPRANRSRAPAAARQARSSSFAAGAVSLSALTQATRSVSVSASRSSPVTTSMAHAHRLTQADVDTLLNSVEFFIFDCDGVIWKGDKLIEGVPETLDFLRSKGKRLVFVTNNSTKSRQGYTKKFQELGLNVTAEEIFSSSFAAAAYFEATNFPKDKKVYVVGEVGIQEELDLVGVQHIGGPADADKKVKLASGEYMHHDPDVAAVVVGFDRNINYYKIQYATLCIRENPGCQFIATNTDAVTHLTDAQEWAGNGSMVGAIKGSTKREPTVVGKPAAFMLDYIANKFSVRKDQICMVGDRLDTDILFGKDGGLRTLLVLSGVTTEETLLSPENKIAPDNYTERLEMVMRLAQQGAGVGR